MLPIYEKARLGCKVNFARSKIPSGGKSPQKCIYSVPAQETAKDHAKFGWPPVSDVACSNEVKTRNRLKFAGCPKLVNRSQPLEGQSTPYCEDIWRRYCCVISFFQLLIHALVAKIQPHKVVRWCPDGEFLHPELSASRVQYISDLHSKCGSVVDIQSVTAEIRRGKKERKKKRR